MRRCRLSIDAIPRHPIDSFFGVARAAPIDRSADRGKVNIGINVSQLVRWASVWLTVSVCTTAVYVILAMLTDLLAVPPSADPPNHPLLSSPVRSTDG